MPKPPIVDCDRITPTLMVPDLPAAIDFYTQKLGFKLGFTWSQEAPHEGFDKATFAGVDLGRTRLFFSLSRPPAGNSGSICFSVGDADELFEFHRANGVEVDEPIADRPYGIRDYTIRDLNGYFLCFGHDLCGDDCSCKEGPDVAIERVDVTARLEKRLAALLQDLAAHKNMSVGSCLEEMILHTNEGVGPHTAKTLRYIDELKKKHAIDYDVHASYHFVES